MMVEKMEQVSEYSLSRTCTKGSQSSGFSSSSSTACSRASYKEEPLFRRMINSFKPYDLEFDPKDTSMLTEKEKIAYVTSKHPLARRLKQRHLQMIGFSSSIGSGLFVGSGYALWQAGPAGQLISYLLVGFSVYSVVSALGEMTVQFPVSGGFNAYFTRFVDPSWGFSLGILYSLSWLISFPLEIVACSFTIGYWNSSISPSVWVAIFFLLILSFHIFGVKGFGEFEFIISSIKVVGVIGFIILGICLICGAGKEGFIGTRYWHNPGPFNHGFKGLCSCFIAANYTFGGIEIVALAAAETVNPRRSLPRAIKQVFWRITVFYIVTSVVIGCLVAYDDNRLLSGNFTADIMASPFVIAINNGGIRVLPDIMNVIILISLVSVGNSGVYAATRTLGFLAVQGMLPKCIGYIDRMGRPIVAIMITSLFGLLSFVIVDLKHQGVVFTWLFSICSLSFTWIAICFTHIRWRFALSRQGRSLDEVLFVANTGVWGSVCAIIIFSLIVVVTVWTSLWPIGSAGVSVKTFWKNCLALPVTIILWAGYKTFTRSWGQFMVRLEDVDLDIGRRNLDIEDLKKEIKEDIAYIRSMPIWYRVYRLWC